MKNRKKADTYRFNGSAAFCSSSINPMQMAELGSAVAEFAAKLNDPNDSDDKKWVARWLQRFCREWEKKQAGRSQKQRAADPTTPSGGENMSERAEKLKAIWDELPADERAELFAYFEERQESKEPMSPEEWQEAWIDEINRRAADADAGRTTSAPAAEVMRRLEEKYG